MRLGEIGAKERTDARNGTALQFTRIIGKKSSAIAEILGYEGPDTLVHRDDMALSRKS